MDRVPNPRIRELCRVKKGLDERIDEGVFRWFPHVERMERVMIAKRVYVGEFAGTPTHNTSSIKSPITLRTLSTKISQHILPTTLNKLIPI